MTDKDRVLEEAALRTDNIAAMRAMSDLMGKLITLLEARTPMFLEITSLLNGQREILRECVELVPCIPDIHAKLDKIIELLGREE